MDESEISTRPYNFTQHGETCTPLNERLLRNCKAFHESISSPWSLPPGPWVKILLRDEQTPRSNMLVGGTIGAVWLSLTFINVGRPNWCLL